MLISKTTLGNENRTLYEGPIQRGRKCRMKIVNVVLISFNVNLRCKVILRNSEETYMYAYIHINILMYVHVNVYVGHILHNLLHNIAQTYGIQHYITFLIKIHGVQNPTSIWQI